MRLETQVVCNGCMSRIPAGAVKCPYCGHSFVNTNPAGTLPVNTVLQGRYTLGKCLVIDGEGVSYAAADAQAQRRVVIKEYVPVTICAARTRAGAVLPRPECEVLFKTTRMDFVDLYRALISVGPVEGLVRVIDLFEANNTAYAVREQDAGVTLEAYLLRRGQLMEQEEAIYLLRPVVYAVEALHRKGIVHRGISPETIYISDGHAKLSGFATMGLRTADSELRSQLFDGYSAPEQYAVAEFDGKYTDVYGLGAVFYRILTGVTPQAADHRHIRDTLEAPRTLVGTVPAFVSSAVMRALRLPGNERIQTAPDLLQAVTAPTSEDMGTAFSARQKKMAIIAGAGLVLVLIFFLILINIGKNPPPETSSAPISSSTSISAAPETFVLPSFQGMQYSAVQQTYLDRCLFVKSDEFNSDFAEGEVIRQTPEEGTVVEVGTTVTLMVSRGPELMTMPELVGLSRVDAKAKLQEIGVQSANIMVFSLNNTGEYQADHVVRTNIQGGTEIDPAVTTVQLWVADAPTSIPPPPASESVSTQPQDPNAPGLPNITPPVTPGE